MLTKIMCMALIYGMHSKAEKYKFVMNSMITEIAISVSLFTDSFSMLNIKITVTKIQTTLSTDKVTY